MEKHLQNRRFKLVIRSLLNFFIFFIIYSPHNGQSLSLINYDVDQGLIQNTVTSILQDGKGFIWYGTLSGISKFDGLTFESYNVRDGIAGPVINSLYEDSGGNIWIGTNNGLTKLSDHNFRSYSVKDGLAGNEVTAISEDKLGRLWLGTSNGGICYFFNDRFTSLEVEDRYSGSKINSMLTDSEGILWISTDGSGLLKFDGERLSVISTKNGLVCDTVYTVFKDSGGLLWIGTAKGISLLIENSVRQFKFKISGVKTDVRAIIEDIYGDIWIALNESGLVRYSGGIQYLYDGYSKNLHKISCSIIDQRGDLWFGTRLGGVVRLPADWFEIFNNENGLLGDVVNAIECDEDNNLYFGYDGGGISILKSNGVNSYNKKHGLPDDFIYSILNGSDDGIWIGTGNGLSRFNGRSFRNFSLPTAGEGDVVTSLFGDHSGNILIGGNFGLLKYDFKSDSFIPLLKDQEPPITGVREVLEDDLGVIWIVTEDNGIMRRDGDKTENLIEFDGKPMSDFNSVYRDSDQDIWICTNGYGLIYISDGKSTVITADDGLSSDVCLGVLEYSDKLFISTINGISKLDLTLFKTEGKPEFGYLTLESGLPSREFIRGARLKDARDNLWFGTQKGVIKIDPARNYFPNYPNVLIREVNAFDSEMDTTLLYPENLSLNYEHNTITIHFSATSFASPSKTIFEFKLGEEGKWIRTREKKVTFRELQSGKYIFSVRARNGDGIWSRTAATFEFEIMPPFYSTLLFNFSLVLFLVFILYAIYLYKTDRVNRRNIELLKLVKERTKELEEEKNKSDGLLLNILPKMLVDELKRDGKVKPRAYANVSILFTDFKEFTTTASLLPADRLVSELNDIFRAFDIIVSKYGLEKLKTSGDAYMAAGGLPVEIEDHAEKSILAAMEMQLAIKKRNETSPIKWEMRCGVHSGSVVAGVVGSRKFNYDVWGDTVNIASRMESSGSPGEINISESTYRLVNSVFECHYRGKIYAKGKGKLDMFFVKSIIDDAKRREFEENLA